MFLHALPLVALMAFLAIALGWRSYLQYRRYGVSGIVLFQALGLKQRVRDISFCLTFTLLILQSALYALFPAAFNDVLLVPGSSVLAFVGLTAFIGGLALVVAAQLRMGASWRVGIDQESAPGLVTAGLYQFCRNPIYLGMFACLGGLVLLLPSAISIVLVLIAVWCVRSQTLEEEDYLRRAYGDAYERYAARIGRYLPGVGRLRLLATAAG